MIFYACEDPGGHSNPPHLKESDTSIPALLTQRRDNAAGGARKNHQNIFIKIDPFTLRNSYGQIT